MNRLDGKIALLSGAARGIGAETARKMAEAGAAVVIGDVLVDRARETAKEIADAGGKALAIALDVSRRNSHGQPPSQQRRSSSASSTSS